MSGSQFIDSLSVASRSAGVTDAIEAAGATAFYLPPYDLNPIEQVFSKLKALLREAAERTVLKLWRRIRALLRTISDEECLDIFRAAAGLPIIRVAEMLHQSTF